MDRRRRRTRALGLAIATIGTLAVAQTADVPLRAMRWIAPEADAARVLTEQPAECLSAVADNALVEIGRAAFRTPTLLGGQAARAGLTCESCHRNGRDNPHFLFPGVSGAAGTADVTSSLFSSHRGNGRNDPVPIPDLSGPKDLLKVSQAAETRALERFIRGLVVEEFDGPEPPARVLDGLAAYVRALDPAACKAEPQAITSFALMIDVGRAVNGARTLLEANDRASAIVMLQAARARLGLIDERFATPPLAATRRRIKQYDAALAVIIAEVRAGRLAKDKLLRWTEESFVISHDVARGEARSLFDRERLSQAANRRLPAKPS